MKRFVCVCAIALALGIGGSEAFLAESRPGQSDPVPGEALRSRVEAYWGLLDSGDREATSQFFRPEDRSYFLGHPPPLFEDPEVQGVEFSADSTRAVAEIDLTLLTPAGPFPWKIRQDWTCVAGAWVAELRRSTGNPFLSRPAPEEPPPPPPPADAGCRP